MVCPGNRNWAGDRAAGGHLLGDSPGYRRRLCGTLHRHHRPGHAELLAGRDGDGLPGHLVGLVATAIELIPFTEDPLGSLGMFLIPSLILGTAMAAATMRLMRTMMLEVLRQDYIRTAWSKGLKERVVVVRHTIKNALIPVVTLIGLQLPILVGGAVIMENIFATCRGSGVSW